MPSVYNYRHVELDKVGRGKRAIQPPGGQTADIFGRASYAGEQSFSSASSQAGSDVGSASRVHIDTDQQSIASSAAQMPPVDGVIKQQAAAAAAGVASQGASSNGGQVSPTGSLGSSSLASSGAASSVGSSGAPSQQQQQLLMAEHYAGKPQVAAMQAAAAAAAAALEASRTPKKTIAVLRRNPITGEILGNPNGVAGGVVRVRQPPGGRSSGIF